MPFPISSYETERERERESRYSFLPRSILAKEPAEEANFQLFFSSSLVHPSAAAFVSPEISAAKNVSVSLVVGFSPHQSYFYLFFLFLFLQVSSPILRDVEFVYPSDLREVSTRSLTSTNFHTYYQVRRAN